MKQENMSIHEFSPGDRVTRLVPSKPIRVIGDEEVVDRNYIGEEFIFVGIANGCVNIEKVKKTPDTENFILKALLAGESKLINLPLEFYDEGWSHYIDPYEILRGTVKLENYVTIQDRDMTVEELEIKAYQLEKKIKTHVNREEFEEAKKLRVEIQRIDKLLEEKRMNK